MQELTPEGLQIVESLGQSYSVSNDAVIVLLRALVAGNGYQAQFNHPELGGMGQWSQGGMIMIGDMFNRGLKNKINSLCEDLSSRLRSQPLFAPTASQMQTQGQGAFGVSFFASGSNSCSWWPADLGVPSATGAQNDMRYACFPTTRRLAIQLGGVTRVYDTGEHIVGGILSTAKRRSVADLQQPVRRCAGRRPPCGVACHKIRRRSAAGGRSRSTGYGCSARRQGGHIRAYRAAGGSSCEKHSHR